ncbi:cytochrome P450 2J6 [Strongylocentrotus purpuratus]|uniref:Cytochrome P450 n=1 Tax=Strongylocentrotus purpuratus TaxID=7668 RepID=A0A7M7RC67_STRPU|nr:cytochrome P450 2J6 [Strongylocentrotus purpuratus]XP_030835181.1 cytochrome P450 2J6 [Strongylocentrotus purpuratus]XP_030835224.1 cytochrome P450 2J6-like [Strongylocentrotus purpuratus]XP_030835225.1 cytochrome P450 2J6-like [Strongylocentrotus purpuratus]XP_030835226.1 cytochrome P450 2J6-like [Strongylocentrotus purpuratus]XP_781176.3 cytochrome P450 2J6 [Strongylocentrotus purpuratus]|eukprot:XP_011674523.1 PREDICTED: cytochrome P450 2J6 [Strongylocentrotus purpuratus]
MEWIVQSDTSLWLMTGAIALVVMWFVKGLMSRPKNLPPGPVGLPFLGVAWEMMRAKPDPLALYSSWADQYGDVVSFKVGPMTFVLLNSYEVIVEAFSHPDLNNRPKSQMVEEALGLANNGVILANGKVWEEQRKFAHSVFRSLGVGKKSYEDTVATEMDQLRAAIEEKEGSSFDPNLLFGQAVANIVCSVAFGTQYKYSDVEFRQILNLMNDNMELSSGGGALLFLPLPGISKIPFGAPKKMVKNMKEVNKFLLNQIESHEKCLDLDHPRDFIDLYLKKMAETKVLETSSYSKINLNSAIGDLLFAGTETTTTTLKWCILYMMAHPEMQSRVQRELDHVVGRERLPRLDDRNDLPYTNAVLIEVQRKGAVAALGVPHVAAEDTSFRGHTIPKGATILSNIWKVLNSEELWKDSDAFKPDRFLTEDGKLIKREELIFFSVGRRVCLGEQLARMETFLGFTSLLHRFTFKKPDNSPPLSFEGVLGITRNTMPYLTCALSRD